jgi:hypothetical protein
MPPGRSGINCFCFPTFPFMTGGTGEQAGTPGISF